MHAAGIYRDEVAYPHLQQMAFEFDLPLAPTAVPETPAPREFVTLAVAAPATPRPMIKDVKPIAGTPFVQWDEPISPAENAAILARLATYPGRQRVLDGPQLSRRKYLGRRHHAALARASAIVGQGDNAEGVDRLLRPPARQRSFEHQPHPQAGRAVGHRSGEARPAQQGERGHPPHHQSRWRAALRRPREDHARQHAAPRLSRRAERRRRRPARARPTRSIPSRARAAS